MSAHVYYMFIITLTLQLHDFDLFRTCRTSCFGTVAWQLARFQLTQRIAWSLGDSCAFCEFVLGSDRCSLFLFYLFFSSRFCKFSHFPFVIRYPPAFTPSPGFFRAVRSMEICSPASNSFACKKSVKYNTIMNNYL